MTQAFVIMTALPFTRGHEDIITFAHALNTFETTVIFTPAAAEPHISKRSRAIRNFLHTTQFLTGKDISLHFEINDHSEDPESPGFWDHWRSVYLRAGFRRGDLIVGGDEYVVRLAEELGGKPIYLPRGNETQKLSGTTIRTDPARYFANMAYNMQEEYRKKIVIFGAESVGKTTLVDVLGALKSGGTSFPEYARPYLELHGSELSTAKFWDIIHAQVAQVALCESHSDIPFTYWDTNLLSTLGYLRLHPEFDPYGHLEECITEKLAEPEFEVSKYYILSSNTVPFEPNELRYGGDKRESDDQFWIDLCEEFGVNYEYLELDTVQDRASHILEETHAEILELSNYTRPFNEKGNHERNGLVV